MVDWEKVKWSLATGLGGGGIIGSAALGSHLLGIHGVLIFSVPTGIGLIKVVDWLDKRGHKIDKIERVGKKFKVHVKSKKLNIKESKIRQKKQLRKVI